MKVGDRVELTEEGSRIYGRGVLGRLPYRKGTVVGVPRDADKIRVLPDHRKAATYFHRKFWRRSGTQVHGMEPPAANDSTDTGVWVSTGKAAAHFGVSDRTIRLWVGRGFLRARETMRGHYRVYVRHPGSKIGKAGKAGKKMQA